MLVPLRAQELVPAEATDHCKDLYLSGTSSIEESWAFYSMRRGKLSRLLVPENAKIKLS
jgi:hypothetical protein